MRKELFFDKRVQKPQSLYILIDKDKIRKYEGIDDSQEFLVKLNNPPKFKTFNLNSDFTLNKTPKYDKKNFGIKGNYEIKCDDLNKRLPAYHRIYIKLNCFEKFLISWYKKETFIQKDIKPFIKELARALIIIIITLILQNYLIEKNNKIPSNNKQNRIENKITDTLSANDTKSSVKKQIKK